MIAVANILAAADPMSHVLPHVVFEIGPFKVTNHLIMLTLAALLMLLVFPILAKQYTASMAGSRPQTPRGYQNLFESVLQFIRKEVAYPSLHEHTDRFMPFLWTLFFFILFNNLIGIVPLDSLATALFGWQHVAGTATAGISITAGLAAIAFIVFHGAGVLEQYRHMVHAGKGSLWAALLCVPKYFATLAPHVPGVIGLLLFLPLVLLELGLSFVKPFALAIRLFANMFAGHVVLASLLALAPAVSSFASGGIAATAIVGCAALNCLELFVAFLQAYIFVFLTSMFIGAAVSPDH